MDEGGWESSLKSRGRRPAALLPEATIGLGFFAVAAVGFKQSPWFVVAALIGHGLFDFVHPHAIQNQGVPVWWPDFCSAYDVTAGAWLGLKIHLTGQHILRSQS